MLTVSAFARLAGVSAKLLRAWDALGLFRPAWVDPTSAYRYYSAAQLPELQRLLALRDLGLGLAELRALVSGGADLRDALAARRAALEAERREIERRLAAVDIRVDLAAAGSPAPDVVVRTIHVETIATFDLASRSDGDVGAAFYELEAHVRDLRRRAHRPPGAISDEGRREIFVPLTAPIAATDRIRCRRLPAVRAATVLHRGPYEELGRARAALDQWIAASGLTTAGPLRVLYLQFGAEPELRLPGGWVVDHDEAFVTELQQPVE